jgi:hypothetical protein
MTRYIIFHSDAGTRPGTQHNHAMPLTCICGQAFQRDNALSKHLHTCAVSRKRIREADKAAQTLRTRKRHKRSDPCADPPALQVNEDWHDSRHAPASAPPPEGDTRWAGFYASSSGISSSVRPVDQRRPLDVEGLQLPGVVEQIHHGGDNDDMAVVRPVSTIST